MDAKVRNSFSAYGLALVALVLALLLRWPLDPLMGDALPLVTLFGAVAAAAWLGGYHLAIPVVLLGYGACHYLFIAPRRSFDIADVANQVGLVAYLFTCSLIIVFGEVARSRRAEPPKAERFSESRCEALAMPLSLRISRDGSPTSTESRSR
jgi:K+-sensing histidine kinase KdpD